jgi:hypothetical protein
MKLICKLNSFKIKNLRFNNDYFLLLRLTQLFIDFYQSFIISLMSDNQLRIETLVIILTIIKRINILVQKNNEQ